MAWYGLSRDEIRTAVLWHKTKSCHTPDFYVELVGRGFLRVENAAVIKPPPEALAKLSFELAETFHKEVKEFRAASGPKNVGYDIQMSDMAGWDKK
ncbi:MAG: hypothetical protein UY75_C0034G0009 [Parcubacteria group bacterium GW2011_GWC2_52_8c]|nr:MAG: hypothetical protein UY75_C0034G0009 [Parcubacteria group bacterium GW2011_GWC2_52_8c]